MITKYVSDTGFISKIPELLQINNKEQPNKKAPPKVLTVLVIRLKRKSANKKMHWDTFNSHQSTFFFSLRLPFFLKYNCFKMLCWILESVIKGEVSHSLSIAPLSALCLHPPGCRWGQSGSGMPTLLSKATPQLGNRANPKPGFAQSSRSHTASVFLAQNMSILAWGSCSCSVTLESLTHWNADILATR